MFRAVHDIFGHVAQGHDFSEPGEESAWNVHRQMMSPEAVPAMTTETRGQTSWFFNHGGKPGEFAEQKAGTLPDFASEPTPDSKGTLDHIKLARTTLYSQQRTQIIHGHLLKIMHSVIVN